MKVRNEIHAIDEAGLKASNAVGNAFKNLFNKTPAAATAATAATTGGAFSNAASKVGSVLGAPFKGAFKTGLWVAEQPVALVLKPVKWGLNTTAATFTRFPKAAPIAAIVGSVVAVGSYISGRQSKAHHAELMQNAYEAQVLAARSQAPRSSQYTDSVSPAEYAAMEAKLRTIEASKGGHAEAVQAARQQQPSAETAAAL